MIGDTQINNIIELKTAPGKGPNRTGSGCHRAPLQADRGSMRLGLLVLSCLGPLALLRGHNSRRLPAVRCVSAGAGRREGGFCVAPAYVASPQVNTHTHTHPGAIVLRFSSIYTQHTLPLLRNKQDATPRQHHSKTRSLGLDNATASKTQLLDNTTGCPRRFLW
jgi:hypothetical protein